MNPATLSDPRWFWSYFVVLWCAVGAILSLVGGWYHLASAFPVSASGTADGPRFRFASGSVGVRWLPVSYRSVLFCTVSSSGLQLSVLPLFRFMHPPMFIPWSAVESADRERWWLMTVMALSLRSTSRQVRLVGKAGTAAFEAYERHRLLAGDALTPRSAPDR